MSEKLARTADQKLDINVEKEIKQLMDDKVTRITPEIINRLRTKYHDQTIVDAVMEYFSDRRKRIEEYANKIIGKFEKKYGSSLIQMPRSKFIKKLLKYKIKYPDIPDDIFTEVKRKFEQRVYNTQPDIVTKEEYYPNTAFTQTFGFPIIETNEALKPSSPEEFAQLNEILRIHASFNAIHSYIVMQTLAYQDFAPEAVSGKFDLNRNDINRHVSHTLAALFLPKIATIENRMLYTSIAGIVNSKYKRERINNIHDFNLFYDLLSNPDDMVCDVTSPMKDLKLRSMVQAELWQNVYNLRSGKYYDATALDFLVHIDACKVNPSDNPDVVYLNDEITILRRLFAIFAFTPITIQTTPTPAFSNNIVIGATSSSAANIFGFPTTMSVQSNRIGYIPIKLPQITQTDTFTSTTALIEKGQSQFVVEKGIPVMKQIIISSVDGPLVFIVSRKHVTIPLAVASPIMYRPDLFINSIMPSMQQQEIIRTPIQVADTIDVGSGHNKKTYEIKTAVILHKEAALDAKIQIPYRTITYLFGNVNKYYDPLYAIKHNGDVIVSSIGLDGNPLDLIGTQGIIIVYNEKPSVAA